jgi:DNA-directed RNA polymerase specialized sigma24 family protein
MSILLGTVPQALVEVPPRTLPVDRSEGALPADQRLARAIERHSARLQAVLRRSRLGSADVEDVAQEAFWVLARRLAAVPERAERGFLIATALRLASRRRVDAAIGELADGEREVFALVELESMSRQEVAWLLGIPAGTVASRLARARARFQALAPTFSEHDLSPVPVGDSLREIGNRHFVTNAWGSDKSAGRFDQRLIERRRQGRLELGWYWRWPGFDPTVFAYPEVVIGWKPWTGGAPTDSRFPVRIADALGLEVEYAVETRGTGSHNLALSTWLTGGAWSLAPDPSVIQAEILVWLDYTPGATPPGRKIGVIQLEDEFELWREGEIGKHLRPGGRGWTALTLRAADGRPRGRLAFGALLRELVRRGFVDADQYITCLELGNEIMGGAGVSFVERFEFDLT